MHCNEAYVITYRVGFEPTTLWLRAHESLSHAVLPLGLDLRQYWRLSLLYVISAYFSQIMELHFVMIMIIPTWTRVIFESMESLSFSALLGYGASLCSYSHCLSGFVMFFIVCRWRRSLHGAKIGRSWLNSKENWNCEHSQSVLPDFVKLDEEKKYM